jgi:hypothetical protein
MLEIAMVPRIAFAVFLSAALAAGGALGACPEPVKTHPVKAHPQANGCVDLNAVPQISAQVVGREPLAPIAKSPAYALPESGPYEGPTLGMAKPDPGVRPTPTVGYHWSLE